ncbi:hypothetical protein ACHAXT_002355 [Thalassiosira profunda]
MAALIPTDSTETDQGSEPQNNEIRPNAFREADRFHTAFFGRPLDAAAANGSALSSKRRPAPQNERLCMGGHRETIFGVAFSPDGKYLASASQESSVCIWDVASHRLAARLSEGLDAEYECLRVAWLTPSGEASESDAGEQYLLASAGADGIVRLWSGAGEGKLDWQCAGTLDHFTIDQDAVEEKDRPQIYALQFLRGTGDEGNATLLTSANDTIYLWNVVDDKGADSSSGGVKRRKFVSHSSICFGHLDDGQEANQFGGPRNPNNELYVFDASYSDASGLLAVALSDGTCRVLPLLGDSFGKDQCVLSLPLGYFPGRAGHLTALSWDQSGTRLATCIASGRVVLWLLQAVSGNGKQMLHPSCISVLEGGHDAGRPLFGARYCGGEKEELLMSWGVDGKVCVWDSYSVGEVLSPLCTLVSRSDYPIYALDIANSGAGEDQKVHIAAGGGTDGGFLGVPVYLYDV